MFCPNCGKEIMPGADICFGCGIMIDKILKAPIQRRVSAGWWWLGFFFPVIGLILWACLSSSEPEKAKKCGIGAIVGTIVSVVGFVLLYAGVFALAFLGTTMHL